MRSSPFKAWMRSEYSHGCMLHLLTGISLSVISTFPSPFNFISSKSSLQFFLALSVANAGSHVGPGNKTGHPAHHHKWTDASQELMEYKKGSKTCLSTIGWMFITWSGTEGLGLLWSYVYFIFFTHLFISVLYSFCFCVCFTSDRLWNGDWRISWLRLWCYSLFPIASLVSE